MTDQESRTYDTDQWIADFERALTEKDSALIAELFQDDSYWRDTVAFTWDYRQALGRDEVTELLFSVVDDIKPSNLHQSPDWPAPSVVSAGGPPLVELFFGFDTATGRGTGVLRGVPDDSSPYGFRGYKLHTRLDALRDHELSSSYPSGHGFEPQHEKENWLQARERRRRFEDREPQVLVVGGGHSGMMAAAHLGRLGVETLIVDKFERVGDNWRNRYHSLALHNPIEMTQLPYVRYPDNFPQYIPKDKLANWFETYAENLDLNIWTRTEFRGGTFDEATGTWTVTVVKDGTERVLRPQHVVMATGGVGGYPNIPRLPGIEAFTGDVVHSSKFTGGDNYEGKNAIVVGVGTSAHDIALDLYQNDATVTMLQRNPVAIVSLDSANAAYSDYFNGVPDDLVDFRSAGELVLPLFLDAMNGYQQAVGQWDGELHKRLEAAGMRLEPNDDGERSWIVKYYRNGGGYYLNVGASDVIADGGIKVVQSDDIATFGADGAVRTDGTLIPADVVVLATGYEGRHTELVDLFGADVSRRVGPVGRGFDADGEWTNVWKPTPQQGLWFMLGGINNARGNSLQMALMIKAEMEGLVPDAYRTVRGKTLVAVS